MAETNKVVVIGAGSVGSTYAYALMQSGLAREIVLLDMNRERALGEAMDLQHGVAFARPVQINVGEFSDCADADLAVVTAGAKQKPGESRLDLTTRNAGIIAGIVKEIMRADFPGVLLMVSNPVDVLTQVAWKASGLPRNRVIGSGTVLDSARLRSLLSAHCQVDPRNIHVHVIGEHGDSEVAAWSSATIGGLNIRRYCAQCRRCPAEGRYMQLLEQVKKAAYEIIARKGATYYAIGLALMQITEAVLRDEHRVLPVSTALEEFRGVRDVALSLPSLIGRRGVERVMDMDLAPDELHALETSARIIKSGLQGLNL